METVRELNKRIIALEMENVQLRRANLELQESFEFACEVERNLHKEIATLREESKNKVEIKPIKMGAMSFKGTKKDFVKYLEKLGQDVMKKDYFGV